MNQIFWLLSKVFLLFLRVHQRVTALIDNLPLNVRLRDSTNNTLQCDRTLKSCHAILQRFLYDRRLCVYRRLDHYIACVVRGRTGAYSIHCRYTEHVLVLERQVCHFIRGRGGLNLVPSEMKKGEFVCCLSRGVRLHAKELWRSECWFSNTQEVNDSKPSQDRTNLNWIQKKNQN